MDEYVSVPIIKWEKMPLKCYECGLWEIENFDFCSTCLMKRQRGDTDGRVPEETASH